MLPLLPPPRRMLRGGGRRESRAQTAHGHHIFKENYQASLSFRRTPVTTWSRLLRRACGHPRCGHCPQGTRASTGASCTPIMSRRSSAGTALARWTHWSTPAPSPTQFGNRPKPATASARGSQTDRPEHTCTRPHPVDASDRSWSWALHRPPIDRSQPRDFAARPALADPYHHVPQPPGHPEPRGPRETRYGLDQPARDRHQDAQRPQESSSMPPGGHSFAPKSRHAYRKRAMPPPTRNRRPPAHDLSDSDSSDAEAPPQWSYSPRSPPRKASRRAEDDLSGYHHHNAPVFPEPPQEYYAPKQASFYSSEPQPSTSRDQTYAWPPPPRDFDNDRAESLASTEEEPDYSFAAVIDMIRTFHDIEKPATAASSSTATAFDQMRELQNDRAAVFHLPTSPLLGGLIDDVNTTLARLVEGQASGFISFPMKRHRRFYLTATPSLSAPYAVPPSLTSLTREKSSDHKRRPILLPYSVLTGLESALAGIGETISWLDWWLSTVSGFREALYSSAQANFEMILSSGSKALSFVGSQTVPALANLLLSRRDSLLAEVRSTVPAEELSLLRHSPLPASAAIIPPLPSWIRHSTRLAQPPTMPSSTRPCISPVFRNDHHRATAESPPPTVRRTHWEAPRWLPVNCRRLVTTTSLPHKQVTSQTKPATRAGPFPSPPAVPVTSVGKAKGPESVSPDYCSFWACRRSAYRATGDSGPR